MFTLEIGGTAVAIIRSAEGQARELLEHEGFRDDLRSMQSDGRPLWNGDPSTLALRASTTEEAETFEDAMAEDEDDWADEEKTAPAGNGNGTAAHDETEEEEDDDVDILFLVDIDDTEVD